MTNCKCKHNIEKEKGVALLSVLIIVAIVAASASWMMRGQHIDIKRTTRIISQEQSILHALSIEFIILDLLKRDTDEADYYTGWHPIVETEEGRTSVADNSRELWSRKWKINPRNFEEFDDALLLKDVNWSICIYDASSLLDVNLLHRGLIEPTAKKNKNKWTKARFSQNVFFNLFNNANLGSNEDPATPTAQKLLDSLLDWFDKDGERRAEGAEDSDYLDKKPPYRTAARRMIWPEEVYLVNGFSLDSTSDFIESIVALPYLAGEDIQPSHKININTVPRKILLSLPGLNSEEDPDGVYASDIISYRRDYNNSAFSRVEDICSRTSLQALCNKESGHSFWSTGEYKKHIGVSSDFVLATMKIDIDGDVIEMYSLIRKEKKPSVLQRKFGKNYYALCESLKRGSVKGVL